VTTLPINWLPAGRLYDALQSFNNGIVLRAIAKTLRRHGVVDFIFINCYDPFYAGYLPAEFGARLSIYHCIDDITQNAYTDKHGTKLENEAAARADVTFVTSTNLARLKAPYARRVERYFNAADNAVFERVLHERFPRPAELDGRPGPVIGFIGTVIYSVALIFLNHVYLPRQLPASACPGRLSLFFLILSCMAYFALAALYFLTILRII
jgi:hypothetical protein